MKGTTLYFSKAPRDKKSITEVAITEEVLNKVTIFCLRQHEDIQAICYKLAEAVINIPKGKLLMDTSDNAIMFNGEYLSFLRDWNTGKATIMTNEEARELDKIANQ